MAKTLTYNRPKSTVVNSTGIVFTVKGAEKPNTPGDFSSAGSSAEVDLRILADADESGASDIQEMFKVEVKPGLADTDDGVTSVQITVTPILGDASSGTAEIFSVTHPQTMDAWQAAAGRARQT